MSFVDTNVLLGKRYTIIDLRSLDMFKVLITNPLWKNPLLNINETFYILM